MAHILVIDPDTVVAERVAQLLIDAGHGCGWVPDAETAMKVLARKHPDLILLEELLPGESGTTLLRRLRNSPRFYDLPVVMLTQVVGFKEEQIAYYNGAQDYIRKPFAEKALVFRIKQLLDARRDRPRHRTLAQSVGVETEAPPPPGGPVRRFC